MTTTHMVPALGVDFSASAGTEQRFAFQDVQLGALLPGRVEVEPVAVGLCATDKGLIAGTHGLAPIGASFLVTGHEAVVRIVRVADEQSPFKPGDFAVVRIRVPEAGLPDGHSAIARPDLSDNPDHWTEFGMFKQHGAFRQKFVIGETQLVKVPDNVPPHHAVLGDIASCVAKCVKEMMVAAAARSIDFFKHVTDVDVAATVRLTKEGSALILGGGPAGQMAALFFRLRGHPVTMISLEEPNSIQGRLASMLGVTYVQAERGDPRPHAKVTRADTHGNVVDDSRFKYIFEATGFPAALLQYAPALGSAGAMGVLGIPHGRPLANNSALNAAIPDLLTEAHRSLVLGTQTLVGSVNAAPADWGLAMQMIQEANTRFPGFVEGFFTETIEWAPDQMTRKAIVDAANNTKNIKAVVRND